MTGAAGPTFREAARFWVKLGFINFGGPTGQIAIMHGELVQERRWIGEEAFLHALSFCMVLPGPEAQQLATYVGWLLHGIRGGLIAGIMFILPAGVAMGGLAWAYAAHGDVAWVGSVFDGLSAAVLGIVAAAAVAIARRAVRTRAAVAIAAAAFVAIWLIGVPFPAVIVGAGIAGLALGTTRMGVPARAEDLQIPPSPTAGRTVRVVAIGLLAWWVPILLVVAVAGTGSVFSREGLFFSQVSVVTFGGAYAVLAYVGREVISRFGLSSADVVTGLGLAETTPGPLILVVEFLAFLAAYRAPGGLPPVLAGVAGAAVTLWATFAPSFLWVFVGAPYVERLRGNRAIRAALAGITAAVLGVIATLAASVATAVLFRETTVAHPFGADIVVPRATTLDPVHAAIAVAAFLAIRRFEVHVAWVVVGSASVGLAASALR
ncbi:MAG: chromate efflux transporter [Actinomycetota bacterium]